MLRRLCPFDLCLIARPLSMALQRLVGLELARGYHLL